MECSALKFSNFLLSHTRIFLNSSNQLIVRSMTQRRLPELFLDSKLFLALLEVIERLRTRLDGTSTLEH